MSRAAIFAKIESATAMVKAKAVYPEYDLSIVHSQPKLQGTDLWEIFTRNFSAVNGRAMTSVAELLDFLKQSNQLHGYCDPLLYDGIGAQLAAAGLVVETEYHRDRYDDYQFGITRASGAIAEIEVDGRSVDVERAVDVAWLRPPVFHDGRVYVLGGRVSFEVPPRFTLPD
jgi:L-lactate dehydrogenase complex protein LldG